jgi:hypothetical protein
MARRWKQHPTLPINSSNGAIQSRHVNEDYPGVTRVTCSPIAKSGGADYRFYETRFNGARYSTLSEAEAAARDRR